MIQQERIKLVGDGGTEKNMVPYGGMLRCCGKAKDVLEYRGENIEVWWNQDGNCKML